MGSKTLEQARQEINAHNSELLKILIQRFQVLQEIKEIKQKNGMSKYDPKRETEILEQLIAENRGRIPETMLRDVFSTLFKASRKQL